MPFYDDVRAEVLQHGAIHNSFLTRFQAGHISDEEFDEFAIQFYSFARCFPRILAAQLVNTEDEAVADELTRVLYSELGDGLVKNRHELLYRRFLRSIGMSVHAAMTTPMRTSTRAYIEGMEALYSSRNHTTALGASFGLENMAITMWDQLIPGLSIVQATRYPHMDMTYFTFHRQLEAGHEQAMAQAMEAIDGAASVSPSGMSESEKSDFRFGMNAVLDYLEGFWMGLERVPAGSAQVGSHAMPQRGSELRG
jgi:pyrroloquinoline quinone (PQQ) biosynthesis protein C